MTTPNIETTRNKCVETCMLFNHLRSSHDHVDAHLLRRRARLAANGAPPSTPGLRAVAVIVHHLILANLSRRLSAASSGPGEVFCPRGVLEASLGFMIDGHQNTSCDKTRRSRMWLHDMTGFMASSINCRFAGTTLALHDMREPNQNQQFGHCLRNVTAHVPQPCAQDFVHGFCRRVVFKFPTLDLRDGRQRCQDSAL